MATYKPYKKTDSGKEEVQIPASSVSGLAQVATSGNYNDLSNKPTMPTDYVTTDTDQAIKGKKTVVTPADADNSTQIANTAWVLRNYNNADICYRGVDSNVKYAGYYKVAEATLPNWYRISSARIFVQDYDSPDNGVLNVNVYAGGKTVDGVSTATTQTQVGFLEGTNCAGIKGHFFVVVRKQSSTERKPIKVELWYRQTGTYQRISATFLTDIGDSRGGLTASNKWVKFTRTVAQEQSYFDKGVVDLTNGFVPNGKFTTTDIALDGYPVTEIYDDSTNNAQFVAGNIRVANSQYTRRDTPSTSSKREIIFTDKNNASIATIQSSVGSNWNGLNLVLTNKGGGNNSIEFVYDTIRSVWRFNPASSSLPIELGEPNRPWDNGYITNIKGCKVINDGGDNLTINGTTTVVTPPNKDNSNKIATTAWAGRRYKSIADFGFTSQTTVKAIVQKIIDNWYEYCTFACTNDNFNNFSDTPDSYGTLIIEVGSNALRPLISFTKQVGDSNSYKHWQANIVRGANNQVIEIQWYQVITTNNFSLSGTTLTITL